MNEKIFYIKHNLFDSPIVKNLILNNGKEFKRNSKCFIYFKLRDNPNLIIIEKRDKITLESFYKRFRIIFSDGLANNDDVIVIDNEDSLKKVFNNGVV